MGAHPHLTTSNKSTETEEKKTPKMIRKVKILSSCVVKPEKETPKHNIWLSNIDIVSNYRAFTPVINVYKNTNGEEGFFATDVIKASFAKTLAIFYIYAGRLGVDEDGRLEIQCTGEGVKFVEASCELTIEEFGSFDPSNQLQDLLVPFVVSPDPPCPLMLCQVTRFKCGGVIIGTRIHHRTGDGGNSIRLFNAWAAITRGVDPATIPPPLLDRTSLRARSPRLVEFDHDEYRVPVGDDHQSPSPRAVSSTVKLLLSKDQVAGLKSRVSSKNNMAATTFSTVLSYAWRCLTKARDLPPNEPVRLRILSNGRSVVDPPLSPLYQGNLIVHISVTLTAGELRTMELAQVAKKIEDAKLVLTDRYVRSVIDFLDVRDGTRDWPPLQPNEVLAVSWMRLSIFDSDFGWGKPVHMGRACTPFPGRMYIGRNQVDDGCWVTTSLEEDHVAEYVKCFYDDLGGDRKLEMNGWH